MAKLMVRVAVLEKSVKLAAAESVEAKVATMEKLAVASTKHAATRAMADTWAAAPMEVAATEVAMSVEASAVEKAAVVKVAVADTSQSQGCCTHPSGSCELSSSMMRLQISRESYSRCAALP